MARVPFMIPIAMIWAAASCASETATPSTEQATESPSEDVGIPIDRSDADLTPIPLSNADAGAPSPPPSAERADPTRPLVSAGASGPVSRIIDIVPPGEVEEARRAGCSVRGSNAGTGVANLFSLAGGSFSRFLLPTADGEADLIMLLRIVDWDLGTAATALGHAELEYFRGLAEGRSGVTIDPIDMDPETGRASNRWPGSTVTDRGWLDTPPGTWTLTVPLLNLWVDIQIANATLAGHLAAADEGFEINDAIVSGYVSRDALLDTLTQVQTRCSGDDAPDACGLVRSAFPADQPPEEALPAMLGFVGGFDAHYKDGSADACDDETGPPCDAISVCLLLKTMGFTLAETTP